MPLLHIIILALIQGLTEFLPISSSGHLVLVRGVLEGAAQNPAAQNKALMIDVAMHVGTLFSVLFYFRRDVFKMFYGLKDTATGNFSSQGARLNLYIIISSIPVIIAGFILYKLNPSWLRMIELVAWTTLIFGILLWWIDIKKPTTRTLEDLKLRDALFIGLAQALALFPGTSRSGITMTAGRWLGFSRTQSAHYSLLLAIVAITGAGFIGISDILKSGDISFGLEAVLAALIAFLVGYSAIFLMMKWLERSSFKVFALYRIVLGVGLLITIYSGVL